LLFSAILYIIIIIIIIIIVVVVVVVVAVARALGVSGRAALPAANIKNLSLL
jgi:hypothetical protein